MGWLFVLFFLAFFGLAIGQAVMRRQRNPHAPVTPAELPEPMRRELDRVLPGLAIREARITRNRDEARLEGDYQGAAFRVEVELDRSGELRELEASAPGGFRTRGLSGVDELPELARKEIERVLGQSIDRLEHTVVKRGLSGGEDAFELDGRCAAWKWEVAVTSSGRLLEVEREARRARR